MTKLKKVLLIDDSNATNKRNKSILDDLNIADEIIAFDEGDGAIQYLKKCKKKGTFPELIFLDISMPGMDGFDFIENYVDLHKDDKSDFDTVIAILSDHLGFENFEKVKMYKSYGVLEHLRKPMDPDDVLNMIEDNF